MVQSVYKPIPRSEGRFEIQSLPQVFHTVTDIVERAVVGDKYYNPNTGKMSMLVGQTEYDNITATGLLSDPQITSLKTLFKDPKSKDGSLTATHILGGITTILTGVRILSMTYGSYDKASNSAAEVTIEVSFDGIK